MPQVSEASAAESPVKGTRSRRMSRRRKTKDGGREEAEEPGANVVVTACF